VSEQAHAALCAHDEERDVQVVAGVPCGRRVDPEALEHAVLKGRQLVL